MADLKFVGAVAIMVACFAVIYPRFMHPLFLRVFGLNDPPKNERENTHPPGFNNPNHPHQPKKGVDDMRRHMRAGPHPGMRAAAEMQKQQAQQGSGRGMMGVVLPMYAIGIVLYLVYTLFKVFNKSKGNNDSPSSTYRDQRGHYGRRNMRYDRMGFPMDYQGTEDVRSFLSDQQRRHELEELLTKVDDKNVSTDEMRLLQRRLEETEAQMSRILQAMQSVQTNVDRISVPQPDEEAEGFISNQPMSNEDEQSGGENGDADSGTAAGESVSEQEKVPSAASNQESQHSKPCDGEDPVQAETKADTNDEEVDSRDKGDKTSDDKGDGDEMEGDEDEPGEDGSEVDQADEVEDLAENCESDEPETGVRHRMTTKAKPESEQ